MPFRLRTFLSFAFTTSPRRDPLNLPDYYRTTRLEQYGPYCRSPEPVRSLMRNIDLRGRQSPDSICALPDVSEEDIVELEGLASAVVAKLEHTDYKSVHNGTGYLHELEKKEKRFGLLWRHFLSVLRKCHGRRVKVVRGARRHVHFDLSA